MCLCTDLFYFYLWIVLTLQSASVACKNNELNWESITGVIIIIIIIVIIIISSSSSSSSGSSNSEKRQNYFSTFLFFADDKKFFVSLKFAEDCK
jgi:hypothetical protein